MPMLAPRKSDEDLFAETTMSFGEHLEELRVCLFRAVLGLAIGTVIGLLLGDGVVRMIEAPLKKALKNYYTTAAEREYTAWAYSQYDAGQPVPYTVAEIKAIAAPSPADGREFIYELEFVHPEVLTAAAKRIEATPPAAPTPVPTATAAGTDEDPAKVREEAVLGKKDAPLQFQRAGFVPMLLWHPINSDGRFNMQATGATEAFSVWLKAALVVGAVLSSPWVFFQIWTFVASGLYHHERKYVYTFLPFSLGLFLAGAALAYLFVFEPVLGFLFDFNEKLGIDPDPKINEWLGFVLILPLGFGISFQLPLVMLFLERIGVFTTRDFLEKWRIAVLAIFVISAVLTPADPYSLILMAVPLTLLYFGGILLAMYLPKNTGPRTAA